MRIIEITDNFKIGTSDQLTCSCCGEIKLNDYFWYHMDRIQALRRRVGFPIAINSGYRCEEHNKSVGGAPKSLHRDFATDLNPNGQDRLNLLEAAAVDMEFDGIGFYNTFLHLDSRSYLGRDKARWDYRKTD